MAIVKYFSMQYANNNVLAKTIKYIIFILSVYINETVLSDWFIINAEPTYLSYRFEMLRVD